MKNKERKLNSCSILATPYHSDRVPFAVHAKRGNTFLGLFDPFEMQQGGDDIYKSHSSSILYRDCTELQLIFSQDEHAHFFLA